MAEPAMRQAKDDVQQADPYDTPYERWKQSEGIPTIRGYHVDDVRSLELTPWRSRGGKGVFIDLVGTDGTADAYVYELAAGETSAAIKHIYEETTFILSGRGTTTIWNDQGKKQTVQWQEGTFFAIPPNVWHEHRNLSGTEPTRYFAMTTAPKALDTFDDLDFVFNNSHAFASRFNDQGDYFQEADRQERAAWGTNYVRDVLAQWPMQGGKRGRGTLSLAMPSCSSLVAQVTYGRPPGNYTSFHRHGAGINVVTLVLQGNGYSRMWPQGGTPRRTDWGPGSMFFPPELWWHGHFNVGPELWTSLLFLWGREKPEPGEGGDHIDVGDEDPAVHAEFDAELNQAGTACAMLEHPYCTLK